MLASSSFAFLHGFATITHRGNQIVSGVAINFLAAGLTAFLGQAWYGQGGRTPQLGSEARFTAIELPGAQAVAGIPILAAVGAPSSLAVELAGRTEFLVRLPGAHSD